MFRKLNIILAILASLLVIFENCQKVESYMNGKMIRIALSKETSMQDGLLGQPVTCYYTVVNVGTPAKPFKMLVDINSKENWLPHYERLGLVYTRLNYKNGYAKADSSTSKKEDKKLTIEYQKAQLTGKAYEDLLEFTNTTESFNRVKIQQRFLAIRNVDKDTFSNWPIDGVISLSPALRSNTGTRSILINLEQASLIDDLKFSLWLDTTLGSKEGGELTIGGLNLNKYVGNIYYHSVTTLHGHWEVKLQHVVLGSQIVSCSSGCSAVLSTGVNDLYGPREEVRKIMALLMAQKVVKNGDEIYSIDCLRVADVPPLTFYIDGMTYTVPAASYIKKYIEGILFKNDTCYVAILANDSLNQWTLGTNFLSNYYSVFDFNTRQVGFATRTAQ